MIYFGLCQVAVWQSCSSIQERNKIHNIQFMYIIITFTPSNILIVATLASHRSLKLSDVKTKYTLIVQSPKTN